MIFIKDFLSLQFDTARFKDEIPPMHLKKITLLFLGLFAFTFAMSSPTPQAWAEFSTASTETEQPEPELSLRLKAQIEEEHIRRLKGQDGGVFNAPLIIGMIRKIVNRFRATDLVDDSFIFDVMLAGNDEINGWVSQSSFIKERKVFFVTLTKGILDYFSYSEFAVSKIGEERAKFLAERGENLVAAVLAHEFGHVMHGDLETISPTTGVYHELNADIFSAKLLTAAGYHPRHAEEMLTSLEWLAGEPTLAKLAHKLLDEHPKPTFRKANVADSIETLQSTTEAQKRLGVSGSTKAFFENAAIPREESREHASRTSLVRVNQVLASPTYLAYEFRERLRYLESYFLKMQTGKGPMIRKAMVRLVQEYQKLIEAHDDLHQIELIGKSFRQFVSNLGDAKNVGGDEKDSNVKRAIRETNEMIIAQQMALVKKQSGRELTVQNLGHYAQFIDARVLYGQLSHQVRHTEDLKILKALVYESEDHETDLQSRSGYNSSVDSARADFYSNLTFQVLRLTNNVEATLDFLQSVLKLQAKAGGSNGKTHYEIKHFEVMASTMARYVLEHAEIQYGAFNERMNHPKTATDKAYVILFRKSQSQALEVLAKKLKKAPEGSPLVTANMTYGSGVKIRAKDKWSADDVQLIIRFLGTDGYNYFANEAIESHVTMAQTLGLLIERGQAGNWPEMHRHLPALNNRTGQSLRAQLRHIALALIRAGQIQYELRRKETEEEIIEEAPAETAADTGAETVEGPLGPVVFELKELEGHPSPLAQDLLKVAREESEINFSRLENLVTSVVAAPRMKGAQSKFLGEYLTAPIPPISPEILKQMPAERRADFLVTLHQSKTAQVMNAYGADVVKNISRYQEALAQLVKEEKITAAAATEFIEMVLQYKEYFEGFKSGAYTEGLPKNFFVLQRKIRVALTVLKMLPVGFDTLVGFSVFNPLEKAATVRATTRAEALSVIHSMLVNDPVAVDAYLKNPNTETAARLNFSVAGEIAQIYCEFEGLNASAQSLEELLGITERDLLTKTIFYPIYEREHSEHSTKMNLFMSALLEKEVQSELLPIGPGFKDTLKILSARVEDIAQYENLLQGVMTDAWPYMLVRATRDPDSVKAMLYTVSYIDNSGTQDIVVKVMFTLLTRALMQVESKEQMDLFAAIYALYIQGHKLNTMGIEELAKVKPEDIAKINQLRYRENFYNLLVQQLDRYDSWQGQRKTFRGRSARFFQAIVQHLYTEATVWGGVSVPTAKDRSKSRDPLLKRLPFIGEFLWPALSNAEWYKKFISRVRSALAAQNTRLLAAQAMNPTSIGKEQFIKDMQEANLFASETDRAIADHIRAANFDGHPFTAGAKREHSVMLLAKIRSLNLRVTMYREIIRKYGPLNVGWLDKIKRAKALYHAYKAAERIWTKPVLEDLKQSESILEAFKISKRAWDEHASARAAKLNVNEIAAEKLLLDLYQANLDYEVPIIGEVNGIFPEGSRHRDEFIEQYLKSKATDYQLVRLVEKYKSYNSESPYHKLAKAFFELVDEYMNRLSVEERAHLALYISGVNDSLPKDIEDKLNRYYRGSRNRQRAIRSTGAYITIKDVKRFFHEAHPEEKLVAFRGLLMGGVLDNPVSQKIIVDPVLLADPNMPDYLRRSIEIFLATVNSSERSIFISWLLANSDGKPLMGPQVVELLIEKGGVMAAKFAQIVASHGFNLKPEYQQVLEKFKGKAQKIDKIMAMGWMKKRLAPEHYEQIESVDRELGAGSFKIGYLVTLKNGRKLAVMMPREYVIEKTAREFQLLQDVIAKIMADPDLRRENLEPVRLEVERIIREEMRILNEYKYMKQHKEAYDNRPLLVKWIAGKASVVIPQPIEGWSNDKILVEEYVKSYSWGNLPDITNWGWSKEKLAAAAINEVLNQLLSYMDSPNLVNGQVTLDIDPHEENQLAKPGLLGSTGKMVNIDLGQSVSVDPEVVRGLVQMVAYVYRGHHDAATLMAKEYMDFKSEEQVIFFRDELIRQSQKIKDPFEIVTKVFEKLEMEMGASLKSDYLYFQKLFATLAGLKNYVANKNFVMNQVYKIVFARSLVQPRQVLTELRRGYDQLQALNHLQPSTTSSPAQPGRVKRLMKRSGRWCVDAIIGQSQPSTASESLEHK